jgi:hypothetical protein
MNDDPWDAELELRTDRRNERRLFVREGVILVIVAILIALRVLFVHGS